MRTRRQQYADYRKTFPKKINDRRCLLIEKRRFILGRLSPAEHDELAECTRIIEEWRANSPWQKDEEKFMAAREARVEAIMSRHGIVDPKKKP